MNSHRLSLRGTLPGLLDAAPLRADSLATLGSSEVSRTLLLLAGRPVELGSLFEVETRSSENAPRLEVEGSRCLTRLAAGMVTGHVRVEGDCGPLAAEELRGGRVEILGNVDRLAGASMRGGLLTVSGNAGDRLGGPSPGARKGLMGGEIVVAGEVGAEVGLRMRRGLIAGDRLASLAGHHLLAGTILSRRGPLELAGLGMRRGTILSLDPDGERCATLAAVFRRGGLVRPLFLQLLFARLRALGFDVDPSCENATYESYSGDDLELGRGELLFRARG